MFTLSTQTFEKIVNSMDITLFIIMLKLGISYLILSFLKNILDCIIGYYFFRSNPYVSIGAKVNVNDFTGYITHLNFNYITISNQKKTYMIKTNNWRSKNWIFYKNI